MKSSSAVAALAAAMVLCAFGSGVASAEPEPGVIEDRCTNQIDYAGDPRSNAEINSIGATTGQCPAPLTNAAPEKASESGFFGSLTDRGVASYYTESEALEIGQYMCGGLRAGRNFQVVYSELVDYAYTRLGKPRGSLGDVLGAAGHHLCPEFKQLVTSTSPDYIPPGLR
jgi:hypothetical protein